MLDELEASLRAADWPSALGHALEAWRAHRSEELATLIDAIDAKLPAVAAPKATELHDWWMQRADPYDAIATGALIAHANARLTFADREQPARPRRGLDGARELSAAMALMSAVGRAHHSNAIERLSAIMRWPHDPRAAKILIDWLLVMPVRWDPLATPRATQHFYGAVADQLKVLLDARGLVRLADCEKTPRGPTAALRRHQQVLALQVRLAIEKRKAPSATTAKAIAACAALLDREPPVATRDRAVDEATLWRDCAKQRGDRAPRLVLADFLTERGDARGELIALQCTPTAKAAAQARKLLRVNWNTWLGDLALLLNRKGTEFSGGMLEVIRVGVPTTPDWVFTKVHGHRELGTVHTVRPGHVQPDRYARFLASPNLQPDRIAIDAPEVIEWMKSAKRATWTVRALEYGHHAVRDGYRYEFPPLADTFAAIARLLPELKEIRFDPLQWPQDAVAQLVALVPKLPSMFGSLRTITLDRGWADVDELRAMPLVTIEG